MKGKNKTLIIWVISLILIFSILIASLVNILAHVSFTTNIAKLNETEKLFDNNQVNSNTENDGQLEKTKIWDTDNPNLYRAKFELYKNNADILIMYIEDLVDISNAVKDGESFEGKIIALGRSLDFNENSSYRNWSGTEYGDLNGDGNIQTIKEELTNMESGIGFTPIGNMEKPFSGQFFGQGNDLKNLYVNSSELTGNQYSGLFGYTKDAEIRDLDVTGKVKAPVINGFAGGIAGCINNTVIENCSNYVSISGQNIGGIVGKMEKSTIKKCCNMANIEVSDTNGKSIGGIAGLSDFDVNTIINCYNKGNLVTNSEQIIDLIHFGGIVGMDKKGVSITKSYNEGNATVYGKQVFVSGIIAYSDYSVLISECYNKGNFDVETYGSNNSYKSVAGICCWCKITTLGNSYNHGNIKLNDKEDGRISIAGIITNCANGVVFNSYNKGKVELITGEGINNSYVGGITDSLDDYSTGFKLRLINCYNAGNLVNSTNGSKKYVIKEGSIAASGDIYNNYINNIINLYYLDGTNNYSVYGLNSDNNNNRIRKMYIGDIDSDNMSLANLNMGTQTFVDELNNNRNSSDSLYSESLFKYNDTKIDFVDWKFVENDFPTLQLEIDEIIKNPITTYEVVTDVDYKVVTTEGQELDGHGSAADIIGNATVIFYNLDLELLEKNGYVIKETKVEKLDQETGEWKELIEGEDYIAKDDGDIITNVIKENGKYNVIINKVEEDGQTIISTSETTFVINGEEKNTTNGILEAQPKCNILNNSDVQYTIIDQKAPIGYLPYSEPVTLTLKFKQDERYEYERYMVDENSTTINGINSSNMKINTDKTTITVNIPNKKIKNNYQVSLSCKDENDYSLEDVAFTVKLLSEEGVENINIQQSVTSTSTNKDDMEIANATIQYENKNIVDIYEIKEAETKSGYFKIVNPIKLKVTKTADETGSNYLISKIEAVIDDVTYEKVIDSDDDKIIEENIKLEQNQSSTIKIIANKNKIKLNVKNKPKEGTYSLEIIKVGKDGKVVPRTGFTIENQNSEIFTNETTGIAKVCDGKTIEREKAQNGTQDEYTITETTVPNRYSGLAKSINVKVTPKLADTGLDIEKADITIAEIGTVTVTKDNSEKEITNVPLTDGTTVSVKAKLDTNNVIKITVPNRLQEFDLSLSKFISKVNDKELSESREPQVDTSKLGTMKYVKDSETGEEVEKKITTATYGYNKNPLLVSPKDIVEYTIRVYNEGETSGYASIVMDDVPEGLEMLEPGTGVDNTSVLNSEYGWKMYRLLANDEKTEENIIECDGKKYVYTSNPNEAEIIVTDYLSKANGESMMKEGDTQNPNLMLPYNPLIGKMTKDNYREVKVQFRVKPSKEKQKIITNHAQIVATEDKIEKDIIDRDSTANKWGTDQDDQDIENIEVRYFDLTLNKWLATTTITENGKTTEYGSEHSEDNKAKMVDIVISNTKVDNVTIKFKYKIKIHNQGNLDGYAKEIKEHIPDGLKFEKSDNEKYGWKEVEDGIITTDYLKDTLLKPGEKAEITVILTWINGANNFGEKINYAEISKDYNEYGAEDYDSTPNNFKNSVSEDDEDKDSVMLQIRTGANNIIKTIIITIILVSFAVIGCFVIVKIYSKISNGKIEK